MAQGQFNQGSLGVPHREDMNAKAPTAQLCQHDIYNLVKWH